MITLLLGACAVPDAVYRVERAATRASGDESLWASTPGDAPAEAPRGSETPASGSSVDADTRHTVRPGDNLSTIAERLGGGAEGWRELARVNGIVDPAAIEPGDELRLPPGMRPSTAGTTAPSEPALRLTLDAALERAVRHDATFLLERERFAAARAGVTIARADLLPQANLQAVLGRNSDFEDGGGSLGAGGESGAGVGGDVSGLAGAGGPSPRGDYTETTLTATLEQSLFDRPARLALARARIDGDVASMRLVAAREDLVVRVARAYFDVLRAADELEFLRSDLDAIARQLGRARREYAVGQVSVTDVIEAQARQDLAQAQLIEARDALADARGALVEIVGLDGAEGTDGESAAFELAGTGTGVPLRLPDPVGAEAWVALALSGNAMLVAARGEAGVADAFVDEQRARRLPTLSLGASVIAIDPDGVVPDDENGTLSLTGRLPILSGGRVTGQIARASAEARAAGQQLAGVRRATVRGTREAYRAVLSSIARVRAFERALESTRQAARATEAGFRVGIRSSVEVLKSLRDRFRAEADLAGARYDYLLGSLELQRQAGTLETGDVRVLARWLEGP